MLVGAEVTAGTIPVPASDTDCGLPGASSVMVTVAARAPVAAGVKLMLIGQLAPGAKIGRAACRERVEISEVAGSLQKKTILVMLRVAVPLLVRVTVCTGLVVLRR